MAETSLNLWRASYWNQRASVTNSNTGPVPQSVRSPQRITRQSFVHTCGELISIRTHKYHRKNRNFSVSHSSVNSSVLRSSKTCQSTKNANGQDSGWRWRGSAWLGRTATPTKLRPQTSWTVREIYCEYNFLEEWFPQVGTDLGELAGLNKVRLAAGVHHHHLWFGTWKPQNDSTQQNPKRAQLSGGGGCSQLQRQFGKLTVRSRQCQLSFRTLSLELLSYLRVKSCQKPCGLMKMKHSGYDVRPSSWLYL